MNKVYYNVIGPNKEKNSQFIEKMAHKRFSVLNDFRSTTEKLCDSQAYVNYLILLENEKLEIQEKQDWMEFYFNAKNTVLVERF